jgi:transposase-like protein
MAVREGGLDLGHARGRRRQGHRAVKRRYSAMHGLKSFVASSITLAGAELAHRIRKRQFGIEYRSGGLRRCHLQTNENGLTRGKQRCHRRVTCRKNP